MANINLLPWRQELRKQRQQEFVAIIIAVAAIAALLVIFAHTALSKQISDQEERNIYIKNEIATLDKQIKEIDELQKRRDELLSRMKVIQDLQGHRPIIVRVFDEMVRAVPDGIYLTSISRKGDQFSITGLAETNNQVSNFMRNLNASPWFKDASLSTVVAEQQVKPQPGVKGAKPSMEAKGNQFTMTVMLEGPATEAKEDKKAGAKKAGGAK